MEHIVQAVTIRWYNACAYYAVSLARGLGDIGRRVTVVGGYGTPAIEKAREANCIVRDFHETQSSGAMSYVDLIRVYRRFALEENVTLVNAHNGSDHALWAIALRRTGIPLVRTSGNQIPPSVHPASRFLMRKTAGVIASCKTIRTYYSEGFRVDSSAIPVIHGGVDNRRFSPGGRYGLSRKDVGIPADAFVYGILARYSPDKGHDVFFRAAGEVAKRNPAVWFLAAGWKAQLTEEDMRSMASDAGISERCVFAGRHPDTRDLIGLIDAGVIASVRSETICRIAMEYMSMGVPVIGTDTNVIPEVVRHGETGFIVPAGDYKAMASAMEELVISGNFARRFGDNGRILAGREYTLSDFAKKTLEAYTRMIQS